MAHVKSEHKRGRRGVTVVETAIVLPLVLLLSFSILEYGWMFVKTEELASVARRAARMATLPSASNSSVQQTISDLLTQYHLDEGATVTMPADLAAVEPGTGLTIQIMVPYDKVSLTHYGGLAKPSQLKASVTMAKEGQRLPG